MPQVSQVSQVSQVLTPFFGGLTVGLITGVAIASPARKVPAGTPNTPDTPGNTNTSEFAEEALEIFAGDFANLIFVKDQKFYLASSDGGVLRFIESTSIPLAKDSGIHVKSRNPLPTDFGSTTELSGSVNRNTADLTNYTDGDVDLTTLSPLPTDGSVLLIFEYPGPASF